MTEQQRMEWARAVILADPEPDNIGKAARIVLAEIDKNREDDELLAECLSVLEYATYHDGRYEQAQNFENFQRPAQKLVNRLANRLQRKA